MIEALWLLSIYICSGINELVAVPMLAIKGGMLYGFTMSWGIRRKANIVANIWTDKYSCVSVSAGKNLWCFEETIARRATIMRTIYNINQCGGETDRIIQ
jgi:hypothetical protein